MNKMVADDRMWAVGQDGDRRQRMCAKSIADGLDKIVVEDKERERKQWLAD